MNPSLNLKKLKISSPETFDRMLQWGWITPSGEPVSFKEIQRTPRRQHFVLEEVESVDDAEWVQIGGKLYPIKEKDVKKLKRTGGANRGSR